MENFVLYEEIGKGDHCIVYKGRRKGTINFLAIHCIDKCKRADVTNTVRLTADLNHDNVVKFYEWYETSNHLWLVVELCTGGSLETVLEQDGHLPESSLRTFGIDIVRGLHYLHSLGIVFSDLKPSRILLDGPGVLKFADFGLARVEGENLDELFEQFYEAGESDSEGSEGEEKKLTTKGSPSYMAPEIIQGGEYTLASDMWALGCLIYEMYTGHPPFLAESFPQLVEKILKQDPPTPKVKGTRLSSKPSPDYLDLVNKLLEKDPDKRLDWKGLVTHPFWQNELEHLSKTIEGGQPSHRSSLNVSKSIRDSLATFSEHKSSSVLGTIHSVDLRKSMERPFSDLEETAEDIRPASTLSEHLRPKTATDVDEQKPLFTLSSRPGTAQKQDDKLTSPNKLAQSPLNVKDALKRKTPRADNTPEEARSEIQDLIYHESDWVVTQIVDNHKIQKPASLKYDAKTLMVPPYSVDKILHLPPKDQQKHIKTLVDTLVSPEKGPPPQKRLHFLNYTASVAYNPEISNMMMASPVLLAAAKLIKEQAHVEYRTKLARVIALLANTCTVVEESLELGEVCIILTEVLRDNFRNAKLKQTLLPALGEVMFLVASQEEARGYQVEKWSIPSMTYTMVSRCLRQGEDPIVNHCAAKIVEHVASVVGPHAEKFTSTEVGLSLWYVFTHSTVDALRITAVSALCRITKHNVSIFQSVIDKVGLSHILDALVVGINRVQQAIITMFAQLIASGAHLSRLMQDKDFSQKVMRLLESPSIVIRAKAFLVVLEVVKSNQEMLLTCCQMRLVMYIERDGRRQSAGTATHQDQWEYLGKCLDLLVDHIVHVLPHLTAEIVNALEAVLGRKHPSAAQAKQLKAFLPLMPVLLHLVTSQVFRPRIVNNEFIQRLSILLAYVKSIDSGETNIEAAAGPGGTEEFIHTVLSILEAISQHPTILTQHAAAVIEKMLPALADLIASQNGDTRALCLRLFSEIATTYLNEDQFEAAHRASTKLLHHIIREALMPQFELILLDQDPLPSYGLKLLRALLEQNVTFVKQFQELGLLQVLFQVLLDHQANPVSRPMQNIMGIINCLVNQKEVDLKVMYDQSLTDHFINVFIEVSALCFNEEERTDMKNVTSMLLSLLDTLHCILKHVSDVVRKALQTKKAGGDTSEAETAEDLLLQNKPFTDLTSLLTQLLCYDDPDIQELTCKNLSLLVQLFGGEHQDAMSQENMECYSEALKAADHKKQKILLRIIKRLVNTEQVHADMLKNHGSNLVETIKNLVHAASSHADVALSSLAAEILKTAGCL